MAKTKRKKKVKEEYPKTKELLKELSELLKDKERYKF